MPLTFIDSLKLRLKNIPVKPIKNALRKAEDEKIAITLHELESHFLASGDPERVIDAMVLAKKNGMSVNLINISAIDLTGKDPVEVVEECLEEKQVVFDTYSKDTHDKIIGYSKDQTRVMASCTLTYNPPINHVFGWKPDSLQEMLSAKISVLINTSESYKELIMKQSQHEAQLLVYAKDKVESVKKIELDYKE